MNNTTMLTVSVDADTTKLQAKLKVISKHLEVLATELESIDIYEDVEISDISVGKEIAKRMNEGI